MTYVVLAAIGFLSAALALVFVAFQLVRAGTSRSWPRAFWQKHRTAVIRFYGLWFAVYSLFILLGTGPVDLASYPPAATSPYKLPWRAGVARFVGQGNRSFTSHRGGHFHAWDFWMPTGTEVVAARGGEIVEVVDRFDGIGLYSNDVRIEHDDGTRAVYAHVRHAGAVVRVGEHVRQGQLIAYSGMVGQALNPHLHFVVTSREGTASLPISFADVGGVPLAGRFYTSGNGAP